MSRGSTLSRKRQIVDGIPLSRKERLRFAMLVMVRAVMEPHNAANLCKDGLYVLGVKPKEVKSEGLNETKPE